MDRAEHVEEGEQSIKNMVWHIKAHSLMMHFMEYVSKILVILFATDQLLSNLDIREYSNINACMSSKQAKCMERGHYTFTKTSEETISTNLSKYLFIAIVDWLSKMMNVRFSYVTNYILENGRNKYKKDITNN